MSVFNWCMRKAPVLLFAMAVILLIGGLIPFLLEAGAAFSRRASNLSDPNAGGDWTQLYTLIVSAFAGAMWPFFGAASLYRLDPTGPRQEVTE